MIMKKSETIPREKANSHLTRRIAAPIVICCVFFLSGCGLAGPISHYLAAKNQAQTQQHLVSTPAAEPETLGEVLEAGTGTFDLNDPNFKIFNPCTEISQEEYAQLGFTFSVEPHVTMDHLIICSLKSIDSSNSDFGVSIAADTVTPDQVTTYAEVVTDPVIPLPEHWYQHKYHDFGDEDLENNCTIVVPTNRGRIVVTSLASSSVFKLAPETVCQKSVDTLQKIFALQR